MLHSYTFWLHCGILIEIFDLNFNYGMVSLMFGFGVKRQYFVKNQVGLILDLILGSIVGLFPGSNPSFRINFRMDSRCNAMCLILG